MAQVIGLKRAFLKLHKVGQEDAFWAVLLPCVDPGLAFVSSFGASKPFDDMHQAS